MGMQSSVANPSNVQPSGKGGMTSSLVSDQPGMGQPNNNVDPNTIKPWDNGNPNNYQNTVGQWDNASITPSSGGKSGGKSGGSQGTSGKGQQPFDVYTPPPGGYQSPVDQQTNQQAIPYGMGMSNQNQ